jgi:hypothetical protein
MSWRHIRMVFIPKPGKPLSQAKSLSPISLMPFILETLEKLLTDILGMVSWLKNHFIRISMPTDLVCLQKKHSSRLYVDCKSPCESQGNCIGCLPLY